MRAWIRLGLYNQIVMSFQSNRRTILASDPQEQQISADHPLFYTRERTRYLDRLTQQTALQSDLPTVDLRRNMRIDHYLDQYNQLHQQQQKQVRLKNSFLSSSQFESIFSEEEVRLREQAREKREIKKMQEQLYEQYIEQVNIYQPAERDVDVSDNTPHTILELGDQNRMREMYLLDLELGKLKEQEALNRLVQQRSQSCQNNQLLSKLSSSLLSSYMVYFDDIFNLMIDEILEDEVIYLNHMEAQHRVNGRDEGGSTQLEKRDTVQMIELVKALQDLCDE